MQVIGNIILVLVVSFVSNFVYALYIKYIAENKLLKAAIYGELIVLCGAIVVISYVDNHWYLLPMIIGGFLGTFLTGKICKLLNI